MDIMQIFLFVVVDDTPRTSFVISLRTLNNVEIVMENKHAPRFFLLL